jgi:hypothetical protein
MRLLAIFCFLVLFFGMVIGGLVGVGAMTETGTDGGLHRVAVVGDQRRGRDDEYFP